LIEWLDHSDRSSRFFQGEIAQGNEPSTDDAVRALFSFLSERILGQGNAAEFSVLEFEVNCDTGRLTAAASRDAEAGRARKDGCSIRLQQVQDYWYDLVEAGAADEDFARRINAKALEIAQLFLNCVQAAASQLKTQARGERFRFRAYGISGPILVEHFGAAED
jgi:hypothetical protein